MQYLTKCRTHICIKRYRNSSLLIYYLFFIINIVLKIYLKWLNDKRNDETIFYNDKITHKKKYMIDNGIIIKLLFEL